MEKLFHCEKSQAVEEEVARTGCAAFILVGFQGLTKALSNLVSSPSWPSRRLEERPQLKVENNISPSSCSISGQCK